MADPRLTRSPRDLRDTTQNPLEHQKGSVASDFAREPSKSDDINDPAWKLQGESRDGSGWPKDI